MAMVMHLITGLSVGGAERALANLLAGGLQDDFDHIVVSLGPDGPIGERIRDLGVSVRTLDMPRGRPTRAGLMRLRRLVSESEPRLLLGWMYHGNLAATLASKMAPGAPPVIWGVRHTPYGLRREKRLTRWVIRLNRALSSTPSTILYNSHVSRQQHESLGFDSGHGHVIPNGIHTCRFAFHAEARRKFRAELGIPDDAPLVGHAARYHPMKNHEGFLVAATRVAVADDRVRFVLCGRGVDWGNEALTRRIPERIKSSFSLLGECDRMAALMSAIDVFCLSSAWGEGFPNVLGEAMAAGRPCVTTDIGDSARIVGDTGIVVPSGDVDALARALENMLSLDADHYRERSVAARNAITSRYDISVAVRNYADLFRRVMAGQVCA